jgi:hypothetical protein
VLSAEKTPTLCRTLLAFNGLTKTLKKHQKENPIIFNTIQAGIDKLEVYEEIATNTPACILATCKFYSLHIAYLLLIIIAVLNPSMNLEWFK